MMAEGSAEKVEELKRCGRALMMSNHTMSMFAEKATDEQVDMLLELMHEELRFREENKRKRLLKKADFPFMKSFENYEWGSVRIPPGIGREGIFACEFIRDTRNLVLFGAVGTGKTHMAVAIGMTACNMGLRVRFFSTAALVMKLARAKEDGSLDRLLKELQRCDLIILDEFGYIPVDRDGARLLFQVVSDSYETRSLIITTNVEFSHWGSVFTDDQMAAAMIDRIAHHGHLVMFEGESYRMKHALMRQK